MRLETGISVACVVVALSFAGCAGPTTELKVQPRAVAAPVAPHAAPVPILPVQVYVAAVQDLRLDAESLGQVGNRTFAAHSVPQWIEAALRASLRQRMTLAETPAAGELVLQPSLRKCYVSNVDVTKAAVVVVEVAFQHLGKPAGSRVYRGRHTSMNWWNSDAELTQALQLAFDDCLVQILRDVDARAQLIASTRQP
ncbi:hypothetical protein DB347_15310 [Opitutaceae bacterium EW11]|nr:hypothetical protein DB347_15310 [Opitutaceae bacterium EW11]